MVKKSPLSTQDEGALVVPPAFTPTAFRPIPPFPRKWGKPGGGLLSCANGLNRSPYDKRRQSRLPLQGELANSAGGVDFARITDCLAPAGNSLSGLRANDSALVYRDDVGWHYTQG
jgi:hypothetical protein